jgi:arabinogalactan oligomer / maltooligosaccharide transport system substrate-binding protein
MAVGALNWGDVPGWITTIGGLFALGFAAVAAFTALRVYRIESDRDTVNAGERGREAEDRRRAQAALVSAWCGAHGTDNEHPDWGIFIRNASETPVHQARVSVVKEHDPDTRNDFDIAVLPPTSEPVFYPDDIWSTTLQDQFPATNFLVEMSFTDSAGVRWLRNGIGVLSEVRPELTIWADDQRTDTLDNFSDDFLRRHGVTVRFETRPIETMQADFLAATMSGQAADVLVGPHDWIGRLLEQHAIEPISLSRQRRDAFVPRALEAMSVDGLIYGIPYASDSVALLRNTDLAPDPPRTFEEMITYGRELCQRGLCSNPAAIQVGGGDGFYIYPLFTSAGGRIFSRTPDGNWDADTIAGTASAAAFQRLAQLGEAGEGILRREVDRDAAVAMFTAGQTPYLVCAPWAFSPARAANIHFAVSEIPPFEGGEPPRSLVAFHGFFLASAGENKPIAQELILDYLTRLEVALALYSSQPRPPALQVALAKVSADDVEAALYRRQTESGDLIPATADVGDVWASFNRAEVAAVSGEDVPAAMRRLRSALVELNTRANRKVASPR